MLKQYFLILFLVKLTKHDNKGDVAAMGSKGKSSQSIQVAANALLQLY